MHVLKTDFNGNVNVGLYVFATDKYALIGPEVPKKVASEIEKTLKVKTHTVTVAGTSLLGVFAAGNSKCLLLPKILFESELEAFDKLKIKYKIIDTKLTALGNNIVSNEKGCLINPDFGKKAEEQIKEALKIPVKKAKIADLSIVGALVVHNKKGCLIHRDAEDFEVEMIEKTLGVEAMIGTVNFGSPYVSSGITVNSKGFIIGSLSKGPEIQNADMALGFISK